MGGFTHSTHLCVMYPNNFLNEYGQFAYIMYVYLLHARQPRRPEQKRELHSPETEVTESYELPRGC